MKLRNIEGEYNVGIDLGTGSVGWAVTDADGALTYFKGKPTLGSRLFENAETAAVARKPRSQRRRYVRRRWRLNLLQQIFQEEVELIDPEFFIRLGQSRLLKEDRDIKCQDYHWPLFNASDFNEKDYYKKFPTIYHLRDYLMETQEKADIRLIYLALHNIVKHRGNFLRQDQKNLSAKNSGLKEPVEELITTLETWCDERSYEFEKPDALAIITELSDQGKKRTEQKKQIAALIRPEAEDPDFDSKKFAEAVAGAVLGLNVEFKNIFGDFPAEKTKISLENSEDADALAAVCPEDCAELLRCISNVYSAYILQGLLSFAPGRTISKNKVAQYEKYKKDLKTLKKLVCKYVPQKYDDFFRGEYYQGTHIYNADKANGYTKYNLGEQKLSYDDFRKSVGKLFEGACDEKGASVEEDKDFKEMMKDFENGRFLRRLKTSDNGSIYYQLHLEELIAILDNQGRHYPFLLKEKSKIESLVSFRIPYYIGPLSTVNAAKDRHGNKRFAWAERLEGHEQDAVKPWNWDSIIDRGKSAENFIKRMTGMCTYLQGEPVLPRHSLLYEFYCVLNELNGAHYSLGGEKEYRFDMDWKQGIVCDLFMKHRTVSYKRAEEWLKQNGHFPICRVSGGQGEKGFESKLETYIFFCKDVFGAERIEQKDFPMIEEIILWNTLFEDRGILKEKIELKYGDCLDASQIKTICKKRMSGWGNFSEKFLVGIKTEADGQRKSIMDILWEGHPLSARRRDQSVVLMEIIKDDDLGFKKIIDEYQEKYFSENIADMDINDLPGSPAIRRSINQAVRVLEDIVKIAGKAPANIFVEVTREEDFKKKGQRTKKRYDNIKKALEAFKNEDPEIWQELYALSPSDLDERLSLYFMQRGRCLYSGRSIDINRLHTGDYEIDHIIPQSYIKDDSYENKALVLRGENQKKTDALLIDPAIRRRMSGLWRELYEAGLIGKKKFDNLMRIGISDERLKSFISRQIVETGQSVKLLQQLLKIRYPDTNVRPVKAGITSDLRDKIGLVKSREANDYHHAHDAFLAISIGLYIQKRFPYIYDNPIRMTHIIRKYMAETSEEFKKTHKPLGSSGFIAESFLISGFDRETGEIIRDDWDAEAEISKLRWSLNLKQCFVSRMPSEDSGAFWDQTIYSPRAGKELSLPLKAGLDPAKYGSYSREQFAHFFIFKAKNLKKGAECYVFDSVPVSIATKITDGEKDALTIYASQLAEARGLEFIKLVRPRILKKQLIEVNGDRLVITGESEVRNAREIAFGLDEMALIDTLIGNRERPGTHGTEECMEAADALYDYVLKKCPILAPKLFAQLKVEDSQNKFAAIENISDKTRLILGLINIINGTTNVVDTTDIGGKKHAGSMHLNYASLLSDPQTEFYLIDQSPSGMFEKRVRIGV